MTQILDLSVGGKPHVGPNTQTTFLTFGRWVLVRGRSQRQSSLPPFVRTEQPPRNALSVTSLDLHRAAACIQGRPGSSN